MRSLLRRMTPGSSGSVKPASRESDSFRKLHENNDSRVQTRITGNDWGGLDGNSNSNGQEDFRAKIVPLNRIEVQTSTSWLNMDKRCINVGVEAAR